MNLIIRIWTLTGCWLVIKLWCCFLESMAILAKDFASILASVVCGTAYLWTLLNSYSADDAYTFYLWLSRCEEVLITKIQVNIVSAIIFLVPIYVATISATLIGCHPRFHNFFMGGLHFFFTAWVDQYHFLL